MRLTAYRKTSGAPARASFETSSSNKEKQAPQKKGFPVMTLKRLIAIGGIIVCTAFGWFILGSSVAGPVRNIIDPLRPGGDRRLGTGHDATSSVHLL